MYYMHMYYMHIHTASNPGLPCQDSIPQPIFLHSYETKSRPGFKATVCTSNSTALSTMEDASSSLVRLLWSWRAAFIRRVASSTILPSRVIWGKGGREGGRLRSNVRTEANIHLSSTPVLHITTFGWQGFLYHDNSTTQHRCNCLRSRTASDNDPKFIRS